VSADVLLVERARSGDAAAFGELVRLYQRRAISVAYRLLNNAEDAADVAQDAFVRAFRSLGQLDDASRFGPWLLRTVSNLALNYRRSRKSRPAVSLDDESDRPGEGVRPGTGRRHVDPDDDPDGPLPAELQAAVAVALEQLPEKQRLALVLFSIEGLPQKEVAEILDCTVELVKWNVFQARKKLKEILAVYL
jgi:RNA polymerase sigma-70 factor (ECF subfamily)